MRIGFTANGKEWDSKIDPRFGRASYLLVYDDETDVLHHYENGKMKEQAHGVGTGAAKALFDLKADVLITGNGPGGNASTILNKAGISIYSGAGELTIEEAYKQFKNNKLNKFN